MYYSSKAKTAFMAGIASLVAVAVYVAFFSNGAIQPSFNAIGSVDTSPNNAGYADPRTLNVVEIGGNEAADKATQQLSQLGAQVSSHASLPSQAIVSSMDAKTVLILGNQWLAQNNDDATVKNFIKTAAQNKVTFFSVGSNANELFVALDKAGVKKMGVTEDGEVRNPAQNAQAVAFAIRDDPQGLGTYNAISVSPTTEAAAQVEELLSWMSQQERIDK